MGRSWAGVKVLVTGAGGFIGGHLAVALSDAGAEVRALCRYTSTGTRGALEWFDPAQTQGIEVVTGDLRDPDSVRGAAAGADVIFHLGALIAIPYSYENPRDYIETNVGGSLNVAQAAREVGARVVHMSTSEVYGRAAAFPIDTGQAPTPRSPYAASKVAADALMESFHHSFGLPVTIARPFNTYGPHQSARAIVPAIGIQALAGGPLRLGRLDPRRDLTFVADTVAGLMAIGAADGVEGRTLQLGTGHDVSVGDLVELIGELTGRPLAVELDPGRVRPAASEVERLQCDPAQTTELTGWTPATDLRDGVAATLQWLEANLHRYRTAEYAR